MKHWNYYTSNELKAKGWLARQLRIQADGLNGNLDKMWPDVRDSAWIGGTADSWERVPYWLDGFIPLAYLLEDEDMIARAKKYIDAMLASQKPDGWICPCEDEKRPEYDTWAVQLITKTLTVYYECSKDERIPDVIYRVLKNYYDLLKSGTIKLFRWGKYRWYEALIAINFTYERCHEEWLSDLARILKEQGKDFNEETERWKETLNVWSFDTHIVGLMMMLKHEAVSYGILGETYTDNAEKLFSILKEYNGSAIGLINGDECLAGLSPIQGTELCAVVEQMYSFENLFAYSGDRKWIDCMESVVFNALPAALSDDMWTHQYIQLSNQIACKRFWGKPIFRTNPDGAHLYAVDRLWGCCTSNFGQGWPKFALSAFAYDNKDTVINLFAVPCELKTDDKRIAVTTNYPFEHSIRYEIEAKSAFTFKVRIPNFAEEVTVNGETAKCTADTELTFAIAAGESKVIDVQLKITPRFAARPHDLYTVQWGPLFFSVPIQYEKKRRDREEDYYEVEYLPQSAWNYAYCDTELTVEPHGIGDTPFSSAEPPVTIRASVKKIDWGYAEGYNSVCAKVPNSREPISEKEEIQLYPYGCAKLRMTEIPMIE